MIFREFKSPLKYTNAAYLCNMHVVTHSSPFLGQKAIAININQEMYRLKPKALRTTSVECYMQWIKNETLRNWYSRVQGKEKGQRGKLEKY